MLMNSESVPASEKATDRKIYVMMGFHTSFYHSWRGDSNDEAGFGTDIRIVRGILKILENANAKGLKARGYWDIDGYFTLEKIIAENAPDIITGIKKRVDAGLDEVLPAPYNNGIISAHTPDELEKAISWTIENPWGSGLKQVFGTYTPIFRPQEAMTTTGMIEKFFNAGIEALILPYSGIPFTTIAAFVPPLAPEQRYGSFLLKHETGDDKIAVIPCYSPADALDHGSFELWLRELRKLQTSGKVKSDLVLHYNFDADSETWLPMQLPGGVSGLPNTGGLLEIIEATNKYPWAEFTTPGEFLKNHPPKKEVLVRQDTADGSFDGYYSWAEKYQSHVVWTSIEKSRMYTFRSIPFFLGDIDADIRIFWQNISKRLGYGTDSSNRNSSFWYRLLAMSTTHFGMSTPIINEERQAKAYQISARAEDIAYKAYRDTWAKILSSYGEPYIKLLPEAALSFLLLDNGHGNDNVPVRIPVIVKEIESPHVRDGYGKEIPASLVNIQKLGSEEFSGDVVVTQTGEENFIYFKPATTSDIVPETETTLSNKYITLTLSEKDGIKEFRNGDHVYGNAGFLDPFVTYRTDKKPVMYRAAKWKMVPLTGEVLAPDLHRARITAEVPIKTPSGDYTANFTYTFSLFDELPYLYVDVEADYPYTPPRDLIQSIQQKLRRLLDLRWIEVGPFQINPAISAPEKKPLTIWKHNYLDVTSSYILDYGLINPKNREIDSFNHQITNGWVAVDNGKQGLLIAQDASVNSVFAFAPMRLRVTNKGMQKLSINPFGTYFGRQFDYSHLGTNQAGAQMTTAVGAHLRPSGPSWNGKFERFRLMLAPYSGGKPSQDIQDDAMNFFYPAGVVYFRSPMGADVVTGEDADALIDKKLKEIAMSDTSPLPKPGALLANPAEGAIDLVWDAPRDERITGFEVEWKSVESPNWQSVRVDLSARKKIPNLADGKKYFFRVKSKSNDRDGEWTQEAVGIPGAVSENSYGAEAGNIPLLLIVKLAKGIIKHKILLH